MLSKQEKKAINKMTAKKDLYKGDLIDISKEEAKIILNLIAKLQKENEKLNKLLKFSLDYRHKLEEDLYEGASNFILRKDKIREIIEEYKHKDFIKMQVVMKHDKEALKIVEVLEELLEGDKNE